MNSKYLAATTALLLTICANSVAGDIPEVASVTDYPEGLLVNRVSLAFRDAGVNADAKVVLTDSIFEKVTIPLEYHQAFEAGTLVTVADDAAVWSPRTTIRGTRNFELIRSNAAQKLRDRFVRLGYRSYETPEAATRIFLAPISTFGTGFIPELGYEDSWNNELLRYNDQWLANDEEAARLRDEVAKLEVAIADKQKALDALKGQEAEKTGKRDALKNELAALEAELSNLLRFMGVAQPALDFKSLQTFKYDKDKDYFIPDLKDQLVPLDPSIPTVGGDNGVTHPYVQKEVNESIKAFYDNLTKDDLKKLGVEKKEDIKLVSAARTPLQQCAVRASNPVAIGLFSTGHAFGVSMDFQFNGMSFNVKADYDNKTTPEILASIIKNKTENKATAAQKAALVSFKADKAAYTKAFESKKKAWSHLNSLLSTAGFRNAGSGDANHYNFKNFLTNKNGYGTSVRTRMLRAYNQRMVKERDRQILEKTDLTAKKKAAQEKCIKLDQAIEETEVDPENRTSG